jgi:hypothetical protein
MAEELNRSLTMLAKRGVPRGAERVLENARHRVQGPSVQRKALRPAWVAVTAFSATLLVLGGTQALGMAMRRPGLDVGAIPRIVGKTTGAASGGWLLIPLISVAVAVVALIVRTHQVRTRKEIAMTTTTTEHAPVEQLEFPRPSNRWLIVTIALLTAALIGLAAWVIYDQASEAETAATSELKTLYDDYVAATTGGDSAAFLEVTTDDYILTSFGITIPRAEQAISIGSAGGTVQSMERIGDLVVMGDGPEYYMTAAEQITYLGKDYVGVSAFRVIETDDGLKVAEHSWVGNL